MSGLLFLAVICLVLIVLLLLRAVVDFLVEWLTEGE
jgi:hypothetical protein